MADAKAVIGLGSAVAVANAITTVVARGRKETPSITMMGLAQDGVTVVLPEMPLQWWPDSLTDSIAIGWQEKAIPGGSHGLMQWSSNGGRSLSFTVRLSRHMRPSEDFTGGEVPRGARRLNPESQRNRPYNMDVSRMIQYLRAYCYPEYPEQTHGSGGQANNTGRAEPPVIALVNFPNMTLNESGHDLIWGLITTCDVTYRKSFEDGTPRYAEVQIGLKQIIQNQDGVFYKQRSDFGFEGGEPELPVVPYFDHVIELGNWGSKGP